MSLNMQTISSRHAHELHRVKFLMPALCRVRRGKKIIQWGEHTETADNTQLILLPAGYQLNVANYPEDGSYLAEILYIPPALVEQFRKQYPSSLGESKKPGFCIKFNAELIYCWDQITDAFKHKLSDSLMEHITQGILLVLKNSNAANILLYQQNDSLVNKCQTLLLLDPGTNWTASQVASQMHMAISTFHRHLAAGGTSFQEILDDVRLGNALNAIQTTQIPISEIARENGYRCPSRFTSRFQKRFQITPRALRQAIKSE
ncbi:helix-turn-helix transcriptional regulator [Budviciaceae bacterium BWR-B9]|uniref:Helix-turn-helix transcriptional regulator n=2 Tax=Budviciaceae TaxID=1903416 RepID=A0ABS1IL59_9GAMM|nr:helix-turn-helix transcriptional regulator [Limnobaculum allomyrinae]MBV7690783.1 helix-turn-helix transcriptional regulator [Limnobaculum sp. M2-1]